VTSTSHVLDLQGKSVTAIWDAVGRNVMAGNSRCDKTRQGQERLTRQEAI
jgi:hypothetical protein